LFGKTEESSINDEYVNFHLTAPAKHFSGGVWFELYIPDGRKARNITKFIKKEYKEYDVEVITERFLGWSLGKKINWNGVTGMSLNERIKSAIKVVIS